VIKKSAAVSLVFVLVLLASVGNLVLGGYVVEPEFRAATIKSNGSVDPETAPISKDNNVYTLLEDLAGYVVIECDNAVFDGSGHSVSGVYGPIPDVNSSETTSLDISGVTVKNTIIEGGGIIFYGHLASTKIAIVNNTLNGDTRLECSGRNNLIANNTIQGGFGICIGGNGNTVSWNTLSDCNKGTNLIPTSIVIAGGSYNIVFGNNITRTKGYAIELQRPASRNVIAGNNIANNDVSVYTLYVGSQCGAEGNIIYNNNFIGNGQDVYNDAIMGPLSWNGWDNGEQGNYWSRYRGTDLNKDGIGDTPHVIDEVNVDNYPLMSEVDISKLNIDTLTLTPDPASKPTPIPTPTPTSKPSANPTENPMATPEPTSDLPTPEASLKDGSPFSPFTVFVTFLVIFIVLTACLVFFFKIRKPQNKLVSMNEQEN